MSPSLLHCRLYIINNIITIINGMQFLTFFAVHARVVESYLSNAYLFSIGTFITVSLKLNNSTGNRQMLNFGQLAKIFLEAEFNSSFLQFFLFIILFGLFKV